MCSSDLLTFNLGDLYQSSNGKKSLKTCCFSTTPLNCHAHHRREQLPWSPAAGDGTQGLKSAPVFHSRARQITQQSLKEPHVKQVEMQPNGVCMHACAQTHTHTALILKKLAFWPGILVCH